MVRIYTLLILAFTFVISKAQLSNVYSIHFETNAHQLTVQHRHYIDSIISSLPNIPEAYILEVKGHTDNKGSLELNNSLSKNRASAVLKYLRSKNFNTTDTSIKYFAYYKPCIQNTEENLWQNRRVEINLYTRKLDMVKILGVKNFLPKTYKFNEDLGGTLNYDSTQIVIAPNSFIHQNGTEVIGEIDIRYIEYRNPSDFILCGIPMSINEGNNLSHFNSGGMFDISAYQNGKKLVLKTEKDKTVYLKFPLNNLIDQNFYQFDNSSNQWNNNAPAITNMHGNMMFPFNTNANQDSAALKDFQNFSYCVPDKDTCAYISYMMQKLVYYVNHEEPIRFNYPYKFIKNNVIDFKSPLYKVNINKESNTITFTPKNSHNKLGVFTNYVWKYKSEDFEKRLKYNTFLNGCSYVRVINRNGLKFKLVIENESINVTGEPRNYRDSNEYKKPFMSFLYGGKDKAFETKLKKLNKRNFKKYTEYTQDLDRKEMTLESQLRDKDEMYMGGVNNNYCHDSLKCLGYFYRQFLYTSDEKDIVSIHNFNLNKDRLIEKLKTLPSPFTCKDAKRLLIKKDSIEKVLIARRDSSMNLTKLTFAKFGINSTGIYNADQVKRINSPVEILANYKNETGQTLKIISIYVSIKGLNGVINYTGYMDYGPYKFVYGKHDETMLIAVDEKEKSYCCTPEEFTKFVTNKQGKNVNFILKPLRNLESSANLQKIVSR